MQSRPREVRADNTDLSSRHPAVELHMFSRQRACDCSVGCGFGGGCVPVAGSGCMFAEFDVTKTSG